MPVLIMPTPLRVYVDGLAEVPVMGGTVAEAIESLLTHYPSLRPHLTNRRGQLRPWVNLYLGEMHIRDLQGLDTPLEKNDTLRLVPAIAGGVGNKF